MFLSRLTITFAPGSVEPVYIKTIPNYCQLYNGLRDFQLLLINGSFHFDVNKMKRHRIHRSHSQSAGRSASSLSVLTSQSKYILSLLSSCMTVEKLHLTNKHENMSSVPSWCVALVYVFLLLSISVVEALSSSTSSSSPSTQTTATITTKPLVVVTGGSRGIGRATCLLLASKGYDVALNYCQNKEAADAVVVESLDQSGGSSSSGGGVGTIVPFQADISDPEQASKLFEEIQEHFQRPPTGLVANAGVMEPMEKDITKIQHDILLRDFQTNAAGPFYCTQEFVKRASTKHGGNGGSIVCISSISAESAQILAYGMSKAALEAMVNGLSKTLPLEGIRINTVQPGLIDTGLASPEIMEVMSGIIPCRRPGRPEEIAAAVEFFLSDRSAYCTGTKLRIAGGL
jgi:NAD(P)-dependent dehydrogenase (short-subunit alcohol dehydrogenase family)